MRTCFLFTNYMTIESVCTPPPPPQHVTPLQPFSTYAQSFQPNDP
jgi:hypothetical protein